LRPQVVTQRHTLYQATYRGAGAITDGANDAWYGAGARTRRTIDGSLLTFQDAAMKVVVDGQVEALSSARAHVTTKRGDAEARRGCEDICCGDRRPFGAAL